MFEVGLALLVSAVAVAVWLWTQRGLSARAPTDELPWVHLGDALLCMTLVGVGAVAIWERGLAYLPSVVAIGTTFAARMRVSMLGHYALVRPIYRRLGLRHPEWLNGLWRR
jgi:hypothetical protein